MALRLYEIVLLPGPAPHLLEFWPLDPWSLDGRLLGSAGPFWDLPRLNGLLRLFGAFVGLPGLAGAFCGFSEVAGELMGLAGAILKYEIAVLPGPAPHLLQFGIMDPWLQIV